MAQAENEGISITLKTKNTSTKFDVVTSESNKSGVVQNAELLVTYIREQFYQTETEAGEIEDVRVTSETKQCTVLALKSEEEETINYEMAIESTLTTLL